MTPRCLPARCLLAVALCAALLALPAAATAADDPPPFLGWTPLLPPGYAAYEPSSADVCLAGKLQCVDKTIRQMDALFNDLGCDHNAVFALTYLRTTQEYRRATTTPGFFVDPAFVNHEDKVFADMYFDAWANWRSGSGPVPGAWKVAFDAADRRLVATSGDLLLGINGHVNRDLPFALAKIGLVAPDGRSRKRDHDKVNEFLNRVTVPLMAELARRMDDSVDDANAPGYLDEAALFQLIAAWRERAWRNAELLVTADGAAARELVARQIEASATAQAVSIREQSRYGLAGGAGLFSSTGPRDAFCAAHRDDP